MFRKPKSITTIGITQILLAATFVVWLLFFPESGWNFAWPITPSPTALFIGAGFIARTYIGIFLWREQSWPKLRWQVLANYAFLVIIFLATFWHIEEMNWESNIIVAHIWVVAYTIEPILLYLIEPREKEAKEPYPEEMQGEPILPGFKNVLILGITACIGIGAVAFINPTFFDTRWPWVVDPFNARVMAAFLALAAGWCATIYLSDNWTEVRLAGLGLLIYAVSNFAVWLVMLPQLDKARKNVYTYGIAFGVFVLLLGYYYWRQEKAAKQ